jgi:hypothetical protein
MKLARLIVATCAFLLLAGGYFASQSAFFSGTTKQYIEKLDKGPVAVLALVLLSAAVILAFIPDSEADEE